MMVNIESDLLNFFFSDRELGHLKEITFPMHTHKLITQLLELHSQVKWCLK